MTRSILSRIFQPAARSPSVPSRARRRLGIATLGIALAATSAAAAIVAVAGAVVQFVPADVRLNQTESDVRLIAFNERGAQQCFSLDRDLATDQGVIPKHTLMKSHFIHGDPVTTLLLSGRVRFDTPIIGVISTAPELDASDIPCGRPGVIYPVAGTEPNRGLEPVVQADQYQIVAGGFGIAVQMEVPPSSFSDQIRVLTCCDDTCTPIVQ